MMLNEWMFDDDDDDDDNLCLVAPATAGWRHAKEILIIEKTTKRQENESSEVFADIFFFKH